LDAVNLAGALLHKRATAAAVTSAFQSSRQGGAHRGAPGVSRQQKEDVRALRVAPIEWLYPGVRPPAAGDLLDTMFQLFPAADVRRDVPDKGVEAIWRL
jgi:hypothetical protein